jgi:hypothetical protein
MKRKYGLFEKVEGKWARLYPNLAYIKPVAVNVFQNALLDGALGNVPHVRSLRPVRDEVVSMQEI